MEEEDELWVNQGLNIEVTGSGGREGGAEIGEVEVILVGVAHYETDRELDETPRSERKNLERERLKVMKRKTEGKCRRKRREGRFCAKRLQ